MEKQGYTVSPQIEGKFRVIGTTLPTLHTRIGYVDFRTITIEQAEAMIEAGTEYLERIPAKPSVRNS